MKFAILVPTVSLVLAGCAMLPAPQTAQAPAAPETATLAEVAPAGPPAIGSFGFDLAGKDTSVRPGQDFYRYANGSWDDATEIPADRARFGAFDALRDKAEADVRAIIEEVSVTGGAPGSEAQKVGDFYASFMDEIGIEALGIAPVQPALDSIAALADKSAMAEAFGQGMLEGRSSPVSLAIYQDLKIPTSYAVYMGQAGLGLPDRDYYRDDRWAEVRAQYVSHIAAMLRLGGFDDPEARAQAVFALEARIAELHWTRVESRDRDKTYNKWSLVELQDNAPGFDWAAFFKAAELGDLGELIVAQPSAVIGTAQILGDTSLSVWQNWMRFHLLSDTSSVLPKAFGDESFAFYGRVLSGTPEQRPRWKRGVGAVESALGEAVGKLYVERHFPPEAKAQMDALVANLVESYRQRITNLDWMSPETRAEALRKLSKFTPKIGYPDKWTDYSGLEVVRGDAHGNWLRGNLAQSRRDLAKLGGPIDKTEWFMTPQTVNAYYNPPANEVVFPAAILQAPFFDPNADPAINYGAIGAVIGHEIGHGFDDQGSKSDGDGVLRNWWTDADRARFTERTAKLVAQYNAYEPLPGMPINGALSLGENIGDLGGLENAYAAYRMSLDGEEAPVIDGLSGDQRFFLGWAQVWRTKYREEALQRQITVGPHSPGQFRAIGPVRNMEPWYAAFGVTSSDALYVAPEDRVRIW